MYCWPTMLRALVLSLMALPAQAADIRFEDLSATLPPHSYTGGWEHFVGGGVALFDCNGDGRMDAFLAGGDTPAALWVNTSTTGEPRFRSAEVAPILGVTGAYPLDIDSDGHQDLVVLRVGENQLLRGHGDCTFSLANEAWGFETVNQWTTAFSATWEPGADWPTLAIGNYVDREDPNGPFEACDDNALYRPQGDGFGPPIALSPGYCALSILFSDAYRIGRATLRLSNDRHYYVRDGAEEMWALDPLRPLGAEDGWPRVSLWGMGIASQDISGDGRPDVMLTSMGDQLLQLSDGARAFRNAPFEMGTTAHRPHAGADGRPSTGWHAEFADLDNDGLSDLFIAKGNVDQMPSNALEDPNSLLQARADGTFEEVSVAAGVATTARSRGAGLADFDGDGRLDLIVVNRRAPVELYRNVTEGGNYLSLKLAQSGTNSDAVGAWVEVFTETGTQLRELTVGGGHVSGQMGPLHFGLGQAQTARVTVTWPEGTQSTAVELGAGSGWVLTRDPAGQIAVSTQGRP